MSVRLPLDVLTVVWYSVLTEEKTHTKANNKMAKRITVKVEGHVPTHLASMNVIKLSGSGLVVKSRTFCNILELARFHGMKQISAQDVCWIANNVIDRLRTRRQIDTYAAITLTEEQFRAWARTESRRTRGAITPIGNDGYFWNIEKY